MVENIRRCCRVYSRTKRTKLNELSNKDCRWNFFLGDIWFTAFWRKALTGNQRDTKNMGLLNAAITRR